MKHFTMDRESSYSFNFRGYIKIARIDHWIKNVFILPGFLVALSVEPGLINRINWFEVIIGLAAICLISSSNYVLNEILDATSDRAHPFKSSRPVVSGEVNVAAAYAEWLVLMGLGLLLSMLISIPFVLTLIGLWIAGVL